MKALPSRRRTVAAFVVWFAFVSATPLLAQDQPGAAPEENATANDAPSPVDELIGLFSSSLVLGVANGPGVKLAKEEIGKLNRQVEIRDSGNLDFRTHLAALLGSNTTRPPLYVPLGAWNSSTKKNAQEQGIDVVLVVDKVKAKRAGSKTARYGTKGNNKASTHYATKTEARLKLFDLRESSKKPIHVWNSVRESSAPFALLRDKDGNVPRQTQSKPITQLRRIVREEGRGASGRVAHRQLWMHRRKLRDLPSRGKSDSFLSFWEAVRLPRTDSPGTYESLRDLMVRRARGAREENNPFVTKELEKIRSAAQSLGFITRGDFPSKINRSSASHFADVLERKEREQREAVHATIGTTHEAPGVRGVRVLLVSGADFRFPKSDSDLYALASSFLSTLPLGSAEAKKLKAGTDPAILLLEYELVQRGRWVPGKRFKIVERIKGKAATPEKLASFLLKANERGRQRAYPQK